MVDFRGGLEEVVVAKRVGVQRVGEVAGGYEQKCE